MRVQKHSGDIVDFNSNKLRRSLLKSGASEMTVDAVLQKIKQELYDGISTKQIYKLAFLLLKKESYSTAARYNLRSSLELLGPAGFYFERYIALLFEKFEYQTKTNLNLQGRCVTHEVDIVAQKKEQVKMIECKFHSGREVNSDVKVPMYILSRFNDLKKTSFSFLNEQVSFTSCLIVTNNRFTDDAVKFSVCSGIELLSWDYPKDDNLRVKIDSTGLYPITCLTSITLNEKELLLLKDIIVVNQLFNNSEELEFIGLSTNRIRNVLKEVSDLCK